LVTIQSVPLLMTPVGVVLAFVATKYVTRINNDENAGRCSGWNAA